jgi:hypothetical protein
MKPPHCISPWTVSNPTLTHENQGQRFISPNNACPVEHRAGIPLFIMQALAIPERQPGNMPISV